MVQRCANVLYIFRNQAQEQKSTSLLFPSATFGHFRQKQPSLHWNFSVHHPVIQEQSNNRFKNVACDSCEEEFALGTPSQGELKRDPVLEYCSEP